MMELFSGNFADGDNWGIFAGSAPTADGLPAQVPLIQGSATFWLATTGTGLTDLSQITKVAFAYGSLLHGEGTATIQGKVPEPMTLILYGFGFVGASIYRMRRRK